MLHKPTSTFVHFLAGNIANAHFPLHKERAQVGDSSRSGLSWAWSPTESEASMPGLVSVTRSRAEAAPSEIQRDLKVLYILFITTLVNKI